MKKLNYLSQRILSAKLCAPKTLMSPDSKYHFWFAYVKPYLDSIDVTGYTLCNGSKCIKVGLHTGGTIYVPKGYGYDNSIHKLFADTPALCSLFGFLDFNNSDLIIKLNSDSSVTFAINKPDGTSSINALGLNTYIRINSVLKGVSVNHLSGKNLHQDNVDFFKFFSEYLSKPTSVHFSGTAKDYLKKAFGNVSVITTPMGGSVVKAGDYIVCRYINDSILKSQLENWILDRVDDSYKNLITFH